MSHTRYLFRKLFTQEENYVQYQQLTEQIFINHQELLAIRKIDSEKMLKNTSIFNNMLDFAKPFET